MDPLDTETSRFWENFGPQNPSDPASIQTEVFQLPTTCFAEENGALVNSARWLQWHWKAAPPPGEAQADIWIMAGLFHRLREMYRKDGGAFPRSAPQPHLGLHQSGRSRSGGTGQGDERPGARRPQGRLRPDARQGRAAARRLRAIARRRDDHVGLLDLLRELHREGQPDGAARRERPARSGHRAELGLGVAGEPPHPLQPRQRRSVGQAVESGEIDHRMERRQMGRPRRAGLRGRRRPPTTSAPSS